MKRVVLACALVVMLTQHASASENLGHQAVGEAARSALGPVGDAGLAKVLDHGAMLAPRALAGVTIAQVDTIGATATCVRGVPAFKINPPTTVSVAAGAKATFTIELTNTDGSGCAASTFNLTATKPTGWTATFSSSVLSFAGGRTVWSVMTVTSPATATPGYYTVSVKVSDAATSVHAATVPATYGVTSPVGVAQLVHFPAWRDVRGQLLRPAGLGRFPAVVLLHSCLGLTPHVRVWAQDLRVAGYVTLAVDSFGSRQIRDCSAMGTTADAVREVGEDAGAALAYLRTLSFVDPARIGVMGWSLGAMVTSRLAGLPTGYRAAVAFYPGCDPYLADVTTPLLLLLGGSDLLAGTPVTTCVARAQTLQHNGRPVEFEVYPGAMHGFDMVELTWPGGAIANLAYQAAAYGQSRVRLIEFLSEKLR